jgi:hypothetical protein
MSDRSLFNSARSYCQSSTVLRSSCHFLALAYGFSSSLWYKYLPTCIRCALLSLSILFHSASTRLDSFCRTAREYHMTAQLLHMQCNSRPLIASKFPPIHAQRRTTGEGSLPLTVFQQRHRTISSIQTPRLHHQDNHWSCTCTALTAAHFYGARSINLW